MGKFIIKVTDKQSNKDYFMEWSTVVDAPVTSGMSYDDFKKYYIEVYGTSGLLNFYERMSRVFDRGTSSLLGDTAEDLFKFNRAGEKEKSLTEDEIINEYCNN